MLARTFARKGRDEWAQAAEEVARNGNYAFVLEGKHASVTKFLIKSFISELNEKDDKVAVKSIAEYISISKADVESSNKQIADNPKMPLPFFNVLAHHKVINPIKIKCLKLAAKELGVEKQVNLEVERLQSEKQERTP